MSTPYCPLWRKIVRFWEWGRCEYCNAFVHPEDNHYCAQYEEGDDE